MTRFSVALTAALDERARAHLLRVDWQEDVCLATYAPSTGRERNGAVLRDLVLPLPDEREVHGNATFAGGYVVRAASLAAAEGLGVALLHSHPDGVGWQGLSIADRATEQEYTRVAETITGQPFVGMTLAGDRTWSARSWGHDGNHRDAENVRVVGTSLATSWNDRCRPAPLGTSAQVRTESAWGERAQADLARLRVLVVGVGTVGMDIAIRLAQAGVQHVTVMDFDTVEEINRDRLLTATRRDARLAHSKIHVALRALRTAATARRLEMTGHELSVCEPEGLRLALDHDVIFSCVDRPWPRAVLNQIAFSDLIPVVDGGLSVEPFPDGGLRNATSRAHVVTPERPCLQCNGQIDGAEVARDRLGLLDDETYIRASGTTGPARENVSLLAPIATASMLGQFVSLVVAPGGRGVPDPLRFSLSTHTLNHLPAETHPACSYERALARGDGRADLTGPHPVARARRASRRRGSAALTCGINRLADAVSEASAGRRRRTFSAARSGAEDRDG